jgi:glycerophosphoryl diester phosphodiesterase
MRAAFLLLLLIFGCASGDPPSDDDSAPTDDDDTTGSAGDDDDSAEAALTEIDLLECFDDLSCPFLFACGHRGAVQFAPENTLLGFDVALEIGVEIVEIDVRPTSDEVLVVMHDSSVDRTTDGTGDVDEMTLAQIRELVVVSGFDGIEDQPVPTFVEALQHLRGRALINVDAKTSRFDLIAADLAAADAREWVYVQVDSLSEGEEMRAADPGVRIMPDIESVTDMVEYGDALQPETIEVPWNLVDAAVFAEAAARGARVNQNALGVADSVAIVHEANGDDPCQAFEDLWGRGATMIQTDVPHLLVPCLDALNSGNGLGYAAR